MATPLAFTFTLLTTEVISIRNNPHIFGKFVTHAAIVITAAALEALIPVMIVFQ